jgi:hypothetical protein
MTIGKRLLHAKRLGIPFVIIAGKKAAESIPKFEVIETLTDDSHFLTALETKAFFETRL